MGATIYKQEKARGSVCVNCPVSEMYVGHMMDVNVRMHASTVPVVCDGWV